jgi:hypothetical protein
MFELIVVVFSETGVCGELCGASDVPMLPVSLECPFLIVPSVFSDVYFLLFDMVDVPW